MKIDVKSFMKASDQFMELRDLWRSIESEYNIEDNRKRINVLYRHVFSVLCYDLTSLPIVQIASIISRDHATVIHANRNHEHNRKYDKRYEDIYLWMYDRISENLKEHIEKREMSAINRARKNNPNVDLDYMLNQINKKWEVKTATLKKENEKLKNDNEVYKKHNMTQSARIKILEAELKRVKNLI